jgi:hypothetical protein
MSNLAGSLLILLFAHSVATAQSLKLVLPREADEAEYHFVGIACSDDHNCTIPVFKLDKELMRYKFVFERTTDGGNAWTQQDAPFPLQVADNERKWNGGFAVDSLHVFAYGDSGMIARTTNAGASWEDISIPEYRRLAAASFIDPSNGIMVGGGGLAIKTSDGGLSWDTIPGLPFAFITSVKMFDEKSAALYLNGVGPIYFTHDNWNTIDSLPPLWNWDKEPSDRLRSISQLAWLDELHVIGYGGAQYRKPDSDPKYEDHPYIMRSMDGGRSWVESYDQLSRIIDLEAHSVLPSGQGIAAGVGAGLLMTTDAGATWTEDTLIASAGFTEISDVAMLDESTALLDLSVSNFGKIFRMTLDHSSVAALPRKVLHGTHIYPNPSEGWITIEKWYNEQENAQVVDALGRIVLSVNLADGASKTRTDCSALSDGTYTIMVKLNGLNLPAEHFVLMR